ncbi:breast cancer type 2 susceptibility protein homolog [Linepithema humile]|uniref:breast cancer type 2 susceptibility protein homolog n=1 Tax=Linepithema humile TaxID=83485 RepID=UPI00351DEE54
MSDTSKFGKTGDCNKITDLLTIDDTEDESDELFSDDEQKKEVKYRYDVSQDASVSNQSEIPLSVLDSPNIITPTAIVPSTPLSLIPFLNKINEQWTSDLETPQAQPHINSTTSTTITETEETPKYEQHTPDISSVKSDKIISDSPVIVSKMTRRCPKRRRIFRSSISIDSLAVSNNEDNTINLGIEKLPSEDIPTVKSDKIISDSPVIVSNMTRKCPKRRRIFRSSISTDPLAVTNNDDNTINIGIEQLPSEDTSVQVGITNIATSIPCINNILEDNESNISSEIQDMSNDELEEVKNVPDNLNTSTQEFFKNASFSSIDELCFNNFDRQATGKTTTQCNQSIGNINKQSNIKENKNIGFSTAGGTSINISKQALLKAKKLLADEPDEMQTENYDSFTKRNFNEQQNKHSPSSSFINNVSNTGKEVSCNPKPPFKEQVKNDDKLHITNYKKSIMNKSPVKVDVAPVLFSTASGAFINISKEALSKAETLLMDESDKNDENILMKYCKKSSLNRNFIKQNNTVPFSIANNKTISISKKSLPKAKILFKKDTVEPETFNKVNISDNAQCDIKPSNTGFHTARGTSINISEQALSKANALFEEQLQDPLEPIVAKKILNDNNKIKIQEEKISKIGFQTAHGKPVNISGQALSKAKALFAEFDDTSTPIIAEKTSAPNKEEKTVGIKISNFGFQTARGTSMNISEEALSRAKTLFATEFDDISTPTVAEKTSGCKKEGKELETKVSNFGFETARGTSINISEEALSRAKTLFATELDDISTPTVAEKTSGCKKEDKELEAKVPNFGFQTARNTSINISEQALSRAKTLFAGELNEISTVAEKASGCKKEDKVLEAKVSNFGFQTARGTSINISEQALSKAKTLFTTEFDDISTPTVAEKASGCKEEDKELEAKVPNFGFQTARGTSINISEQALSKAKTLFTTEFDDISTPTVAEKASGCKEEDKELEAKVPNFGFQTARNTSNNISEQALSRAKTLFAGELNEISTVAEKASGCKKEDKVLEAKVPNFGFQTARNTSINISEQALSRAKTLFAGELSTLTVAEKTSAHKEEKAVEVKVSNFGFQTARGSCINISEQALSEAKSLFANQLNDPLDTDIAENIEHNNEDAKRRDLTNTHSGIETASGQPITVSSNALKERALVSSYVNENSPVVENALLQKRKRSEINSDESTPLGRSCASEMKKARLSNEFQGRKLFSNDSDVDMDNDEILNLKRHASSIASFVPGSPKRDTEEPSKSHAAGSPIIGGQPILRKTKSLGYRREKNRASKVDKTEIENVSPNEKARKNVSSKKSDDSESNVETQPATENITESSEYSDNQIMMAFIDESTKILQDRLAAALEQEKIITAKRRCGSKQSIGYLYLYKQTNSNARLSLREISNGAPPVPRSYQELIDRRIPPNILSITAATAVCYKFRCSDFYGNDMARSNVHGIQMEDNVRLIMDENGYVGIWEFLRAFLASTGVDPNLVPARWIENHYRWIVWKLASMDRMTFGSAELPRALTPSRVMAQLKYRYDREIDRSERPAIRRILEKDDVASKRMILCVSSIIENNNVSIEAGRSPHVGLPKWKIELTDGWYSISACIDAGIVKSVSTGKIKEGTKLVVSGAELLNCDQGCYPLEAPIDVCLKLHTNSTRRARWDAKLGYASRSGPIPIRLHNVCQSGGLIGKMTIIVARVYPMLYHEKTASGDSIMRNAKCEEKAQSKYEQQCWSNIETFYAKAEKDFQGKDFSCEDDAELSEDYETSSTVGSVSKKRHELLQELRQREERLKQELQSKLRESLPGPRQVSPLLKVRVCDGNANAILSVWSPGEEVVDAVKEGACVSLCNVAASGKRGNELQLTAGRCAVFKPGKMHDTSYPARMCTSLCEIADSEFAPPYAEFDTVGFVCSFGPAPYGMKDFEVAHLAHPKANSNESSYLSILFWQGIVNYGYAEILTVGSIVACSNLEWRRATSWNVPVAYCTERSTFTRNSRRNHLYESFESLRNLIKDPIEYAEECTSELNMKLQKKPTPTRCGSGKNTPIKIYNSTSSVDKKLVDASPLSTPKLGAGSSSNYITSRPSIQRRLEKLQYYDEPPELSPITFRKSKRVSLDFRSPIRISDVNKDASSTNQSKDSSNTPNKQQ